MSENQMTSATPSGEGSSTGASTSVSNGQGTATVNQPNNQVQAGAVASPGLDWQRQYQQAESLIGKQGQELGQLKQTLDSLVSQQNTQKSKLAEYFGITKPEEQKGFLDNFFEKPEDQLNQWFKEQVSPIASEISQIKLEKFQAQQVAQQQEVESQIAPILGTEFISKVRNRINSMPNPNRFNDPANAHLNDQGNLNYGLEQIYKRGYKSVFNENLGSELVENFPSLVSSLDQQRQNSAYNRQRAKSPSSYAGGGFGESSQDADYGISYRVKNR